MIYDAFFDDMIWLIVSHVNKTRSFISGTFYFRTFWWFIEFQKWEKSCDAFYFQSHWIYVGHHIPWTCSSCIVLLFPFQAMAKEETRRTVCPSFEVVWRGWWTWAWTWSSGLKNLELIKVMVCLLSFCFQLFNVQSVISLFSKLV